MNQGIKAFALMFCISFTLTVLALAGLSYGADTVTPVRRILNAMPVHVTDQGEAPETRAARLDAIEGAIIEATQVPIERAALLTIARGESHLSAYVFEHRCADGPAGARECDSGRAKGVFQLHANRLYPEIPDDVGAQARIAIAQWRCGLNRCAHQVPDNVAGAFDSYGTGGKCAPSEMGKSRAAEARRYAGRL